MLRQLRQFGSYLAVLGPRRDHLRYLVSGAEPVDLAVLGHVAHFSRKPTPEHNIRVTALG